MDQSKILTACAGDAKLHLDPYSGIVCICTDRRKQELLVPTKSIQAMHNGFRRLLVPSADLVAATWQKTEGKWQVRVTLQDTQTNVRATAAVCGHNQHRTMVRAYLQSFAKLLQKRRSEKRAWSHEARLVCEHCGGHLRKNGSAISLTCSLCGHTSLPF